MEKLPDMAPGSANPEPAKAVTPKGSERTKSDKLTERDSTVTIERGAGVIARDIVGQTVEAPRPAKPLPRRPQVVEGGKVAAVASKQGIVHRELEQALELLTKDSSDLSGSELMARLEKFNKTDVATKHWDRKAMPSESLFNNITSPEKTRLSPDLHANWLDSKKTFAGFMYPTEKNRGQALEAMMENGITRHAHLPNDFAVWLQHKDTGPFFPMSSTTFESMRGERKMDTEIGPVTVHFGDVSRDDKGQLVGSLKVSGTLKGRPVTREVQWPLNSMELPSGLRFELVSTSDHDTYAYKNDNGDTLHQLEVDSILWRDFEGIPAADLHHLASRLAEVEHSSAGCRAGVGRTGTTDVAVQMLKWARANPDKKITNKELLTFIAEARLNRDQQVVQTEAQMSLLVRYKDYLNDNPELALGDRMKRLDADLPEAAKGGHILAKDLHEKLERNPILREILSDPTRELSAADEALLDEVYEMLSDPISGDLFSDPVITPYGHTYDRSTLTQWFQKQREHRGGMGFSPHLQTTDPLTRRPLTQEALKPDLFIQRLQSLLIQRAGALTPATDIGKAKVAQLERMAMNEPLQWCRMLSTVMPQNSYFVRRKGFGGSNDFVLEFRGKVKVQKCGFGVNAEGRLQPTTKGAPSFATVEELVAWLSKSDPKNGNPNQPPVLFSQNQIDALNTRMGKAQFMADVRRDPLLLTTIKHLEMRFEDGKVEDRFRRGGYVRAGVNPSSFPCFTYVRPGGNKSRLCLSNGKLCEVDSCSIKPAKSLQEAKEQIDGNKRFTSEEKEAFKAELDAVQGELDMNKPFTLFIQTNKPVDALVLAPISQEEERRGHETGYSVVF